MAAKKSAAGGKGTKDAIAKERAEAAKEEADSRASVVRMAKEEVVDRYLVKLELSREGTREEKVLRLYGFLNKRFAVGAVEAALEKFMQYCDCCMPLDGRFDACPGCGDMESEGGMSAAEKRKPGNTEADAIKQILAKWPAGFERVTPGAVRTSPAAVKEAKRTRTEAAPPTKPVVAALPEPEEKAPTVDEVVAEFAKILDADPDDSIALTDLAGLAGENLGWDLALDLVKAAAIQLVDSGRASRQGAMLRSTKTSPAHPGYVERVGDDEGVEPDDEIQGDGEPVDEEEIAREGAPGIEADDEPAPIEVRAEVMPVLPSQMPLLAVATLDDIGPATAETLDRVVHTILRLHGVAVHSTYEMGRLLLDVNKRSLYLQRRGADGNPVYKTFAQFVSEELKFGKSYAYDLMKLPGKFTRVQLEDPRLGPAKLHVLLQVDDVALRNLLTTETASNQLTLGETKELVREKAPGALPPKSDPPPVRPQSDRSDSQDEEEVVPEAKKPTPKPEPTRGKAPEAVPVPRGERITTCVLKHGRTTIPLFAKAVKGKEPKPAKKLADDPWALVELPNGVRIKFSIQEKKGALVLVQDVESDG